MKLILDDLINKELEDYLLSQEGIINVDLNNNSFLTEINIKFNNKTNPIIIMKYIELFQKYKYSVLVEFDKGYIGNFKTLKYVVKDMCCDYCYKDLVKKLFDNELIKSVKSNFDFNKPAFNIEFIIEYFENYDENELIKYIKAKL